MNTEILGVALQVILMVVLAYPLGKFQFPIVRIKVSCNDTNSFPVRDYSFPVRKLHFSRRETIVPP